LERWARLRGETKTYAQQPASVSPGKSASTGIS
jgi:hypothetical protein